MQFIYQLLYSPAFNPVVRFICKYFLGGKVMVPPSGILSIRPKTGNSIELATNQTCHVTKHIYYYGFDKFEFAEYFCQIIPKFDVFVDVGANIGLYSMLAAANNKKISVYAFEPSPGPFHYLSKNIDLNNASAQIMPINKALTDANGSVEFSVPYVSKYGYLAHNNLGGGGHVSAVRESVLTEKITVEAQTLDDFAKEYKLFKLDVLKLDAENSEHLIIKGGAESIKKFRPIIFTEIFSTEMALKIEAEILSLNYVIYYVDGNVPKLIPNIHSAFSKDPFNAMLVPKEKVSLLNLI
jgi:FkbM family methyltransferase